MKRVLCYFSVFCSMLFIGCDNPIDDMPNNNSDEVIIHDVSVDKNGFLVFKDQTVYQKSSSLIDSMTDLEFQNWEQQIGFLSAQTFLDNVDKEFSMIENQVQYDNFKIKYSGKLIFTDEGDVNLPFYATAWSRVLSPEGIMKIGDVLYKFDEEKQISIIGGQYEDTKKIFSNPLDTSLVKIFYPNKNNDNNESYKSTTLPLGTKTFFSRDGESKLTYSLQLINFYYYGYGSTGVIFDGAHKYTTVGYELKFTLLQKRKGIFNNWYKNTTMYYFKDFYFDYMYSKLVKPLPFRRTDGTWTEIWTENLDVYDIFTYDYFESPETNDGVTGQLFYYNKSMDGSYSQIKFNVYDLHFECWSRGFKTDETIMFSFNRSF